MKLTPWTLTVATFLMVGGIAVSYFFKNPLGNRLTVETDRVYLNRPAPRNSQNAAFNNNGVFSQADTADPSGYDITQPVPSESTDFAANTVPADAQAIIAPSLGHSDAEQSETMPPLPSLPVLPLPPSATGDVALSGTDVPPAIAISIQPDQTPADAEPAISISTIERPASSGEPAGFVTQQYRSVKRTDVRFVNRRPVAPSAQVATNPQTSPR